MRTSTVVPLEASGLTKAFDGKRVLDNLNLTIEPGMVLGLLGANGTGKTTLIKCLLGLLRPTEGAASVFGEDSWNLSAKSKARIGYVPQEVATYPWMRVRHVIDYTAAFYPNWNQSLVDSMCRQWKLPLDDRSGALSVGQLQALGIVLALGHEPELLILDEPVASLDPNARREFLRTLLQMVEDPNRTVVFSTHITSDLERVASRIALLRDGKVEFNGELDELKDRVKRIRLTAPHDLPASFEVPGAMHLEIDGRLATFTVTDYSPELSQRLRSFWEADIAVADLNLEEIFVELHEERQEQVAVGASR